jgi:hypothetical protein
MAKVAALCTNGPVKVNLARTAAILGCSRETLRKRTMLLRDSAWFFQDKRAVLYVTHDRSASCPRGRWTLWLVHRQALHRVGAQPGPGRQIRYHARRGEKEAWRWYLWRIAEWAQALLFGLKKDTAHTRGSLREETGPRANGAHGPPKKRAALRRFGGVGAQILAALGGEKSYLYGWTINRLAEWHSHADILWALRHAFTLAAKTRTIAIANLPSWVSGVATAHLNRDGFLPTQRKRHLREGIEGRALTRPEPGKAFKDCGEKPSASYGWQSGTQIYVDTEGKRWDYSSGFPVPA